MKMKAFNWQALIRSAARKIWLWSPMRKEAIKNARITKGYVQCAQCEHCMKENAKPKEYDVDHIVPASEPTSNIHSWDDFFKRLFVPASGLQILCKPCHAEKTLRENTIRKRTPKKAKRKNRTKRQR